jgi:hypothetical protein
MFFKCCNYRNIPRRFFIFRLIIEPGLNDKSTGIVKMFLSAWPYLDNNQYYQPVLRFLLLPEAEKLKKIKQTRKFRGFHNTFLIFLVAQFFLRVYT